MATLRGQGASTYDIGEAPPFVGVAVNVIAPPLEAVADSERVFAERFAVAAGVKAMVCESLNISNDNS